MLSGTLFARAEPLKFVMATLAGHALVLEKVCRIGGVKFSRHGKSTSYVAGEIKSCFGVDILSDEENIHPKQICELCYKVIQRYMNTSTGTFVVSGGCGNVKVWEEHEDSNCVVCTEARAVGRPAKKKISKNQSLQPPRFSLVYDRAQ